MDYLKKLKAIIGKIGQDKAKTLLGVSLRTLQNYTTEVDPTTPHPRTRDLIEKYYTQLFVDSLDISEILGDVKGVVDQDADLESRRSLERTLENLSEDKMKSTAIIERLVTLLEKNFGGVHEMELPLVGTPGTKTMPKKEEKSKAG